MKKMSNIVWGVVLVAVGVILALNALDITDITLFFDGWWTLFIIVPCFVSLITDSNKLGSFIGILIGIFLLLCCRGIMSFALLWKLLLPAIVVIIGIKLIFGTLFNNKTEKITKEFKNNGAEIKHATATFSGINIECAYEPFGGAEINAIFGGVKCDLRQAIITHDCVINASAIFGGVDIILPQNVNIKVRSNSIFGGVSNKANNEKQDNRPTVYINATCIFGGVDIK